MARIVRLEHPATAFRPSYIAYRAERLKPGTGVQRPDGTMVAPEYLRDQQAVREARARQDADAARTSGRVTVVAEIPRQALPPLRYRAKNGRMRTVGDGLVAELTSTQTFVEELLAEVRK